MAKRYHVVPCDNLDTLDPPPPRQRTWLVLDRASGDQQVAEFDTRHQARIEAKHLNAS